jgi:hypothetical protein
MPTLDFGKGPYLEEGVEEGVAHRVLAPGASSQGGVDGTQLTITAEGAEDATIVVVGHSLSPLLMSAQVCAFLSSIYFAEFVSGALLTLSFTP